MKTFQELAFEICRCYTIDSHVSGNIDENVQNRVLGWLRARDIARLSTCPDQLPGVYQSLDLLRFARQVAAFFKKNAAFEGEDAESKALSSFFEAEQKCKITNDRLDASGLDDNLASEEVKEVIQAAVVDIQVLLGGVEDLVGSIPNDIRVTSGASASAPRRKSLPYMKLKNSDIQCTQGAIPFLDALYRYHGFTKTVTPERRFRRVVSNRVVTVPKNWKTRRTIACEPEGNLPLQLAVDAYLKRYLLKWGIDLADQNRNQTLARKGSIDGSLCTIDLSMASDTLSLNTACRLLPTELFKILCMVRSPCGEVGGKTIVYEKLSSMGNGSTFTVETLIFAAIARATGSETVSVYGDDIIIDNDKYGLMCEALEYLGFQPNLEKSYATGSFRESCGTDWFNGINITPFYFKAQNAYKAEMCLLVNGLFAITRCEGLVTEYALNLIQEHALPIVPYNEDPVSGIWVTPSTAYDLKIFRRQKNLHSLSYRAYRPKAKSKQSEGLQNLFHWYIRSLSKRPKLYHHTRVLQNVAGVRVYSDNIGHIEESLSVTSVPTLAVKLRLGTVMWNPPHAVTPSHLYWCDMLISRVS